MQNGSQSLTCSSPYESFTRREYYRSSGIKVIANWIQNHNLSNTIYNNWTTTKFMDSQLYDLALDSLYNRIWPDAVESEIYCTFYYKTELSCNYTYKFKNTIYQACSSRC